MLTKISLVVALCSQASMSSIQTKVKEIEAHNHGSKVSVRLDSKAKCDAQGNVIQKASKGGARE